jgi:hypothetical protein
MALIACTSCGLPRTAADAEASPCPACGWRLGDPEPVEEMRVEPAPAAPAAEPLRCEGLSRPGIAVAAAIVFAAVAGVLAVGSWPDEARPITVMEPAPDYDPGLLELLAPAPPPPSSPQLAIAPPPREVEPEEVGPTVILPVPVPVVHGPAVIRMEDANATFELSRLAAKNQVKLVGQARLLRIGGLDEGATLDATELSVRTVYVNGHVDRGSTLMIRSKGTKVNFRGKVDGGSRVVLDIRGGQATFSTLKSGGGVGGGSRVSIVAKTVNLNGSIRGPGTSVEITLTPPARLEYTAVADRAKLHYRLEHRADPLPRITRGSIAPGAIVVEDLMP